MYSSSSIVLVDDCLSAVDSPTAKHIFEQCLMGDLMRNRTCVLVTHHIGLTLAKADFVAVLKDGQIVGSGTPDQVRSMALVADVLTDIKPADEAESEAKPEVEVHKADGNGVLVAEEEREIGNVKWPVYMYFMHATGGIAFWAVAIGMVLASQAMYVAQTYWIRVWANSNVDASGLRVSLHPAGEVPRQAPAMVASAILAGSGGSHQSLEESVEYYLTIYAILGIVAVGCALVKDLILFIGQIRAARQTHSDLLHRIVYAKPRFFDVTPIGRILNRFSKDIDTIDNQVMSAIRAMVVNVIELVAIIGVIVYVTPVFLLAGVVVTALMMVDGRLYVNASRDLKRIESITMSPMLSLFGEMIQ